MTLNVQLITMVSMILSGIYLGIAFETYRKLAIWWRHHSIFKFICDLVFSLSQTAILFYVLYEVNDGQLRLYVFLACLLGVNIYVVFFRRSYIWLIDKIFKLLSMIFNGLYKIVNLTILLPILNIMRLLYTLLTYTLKGILFIITNILFKGFRKIFLVFYSFLPASFLNKGSQIKRKYSIIKKALNLKWQQLFKKGGND